MPDNHTSSGDALQPISQPQLPPGPAEITFKKSWTGKVGGRKATQLRKTSDETPETVKVVEIKGGANQANRLLRGGLSRQDCIEEASR